MIINTTEKVAKEIERRFDYLHIRKLPESQKAEIKPKYYAAWKDTDPRFDIYKRSDIIILRPKPYTPRVSLAHVETKHAYFITTEFPKPYKHIGEGDEWPEGWRWIQAPDFS